MSFASNIKAELCRRQVRTPCCRRSELAGLVITNGNLLRLGGQKQVQLTIVTEHAFIARRLYTLLKSELGVVAGILVRKKARLRKNFSYLVQIAQPHQAATVLAELGITGPDYSLRDNPVLHGGRRCCRKAFLRGCFLAGGSVSNPETNGYHLEIATEYQDQAENIKALLAQLEIRSGTVRRKHHYVVYLKDSEQIAAFLSTIGSNQGRLAFENARIYKEIKNRVNRLVNCETANVNKTVEAAQRQVAAINALAVTLGLDNLSPALRQVARLRLEYPEATLDELGRAATPPLSKSAVNYRLRKLVDMAEAQQGTPDNGPGL